MLTPDRGLCRPLLKAIITATVGRPTPLYSTVMSYVMQLQLGQQKGSASLNCHLNKYEAQLSSLCGFLNDTAGWSLVEHTATPWMKVDDFLKA